MDLISNSSIRPFDRYNLSPIEVFDSKHELTNCIINRSQNRSAAILIPISCVHHDIQNYKYLRRQTPPVKYNIIYTTACTAHRASHITIAGRKKSIYLTTTDKTMYISAGNIQFIKGFIFPLNHPSS